MRAQQFELIYSQSGLLYNILPDAPRSILDKTRQRVGPHADGIVGSTQTKPAEQLTKQLQQLSIQHSAAKQTTALAASPTQMSEVRSVQTTNPKATQQPEGKKKQRKKGKGIRNPLIMIARAPQKRGRRGIRTTYVWKTTRPIYVLNFRRPRSLSHSNSKPC
jgi:hypothetical protein